MKRKEAKDQQRKRDAPELEKKEAALRKIIALKKGTPEAAQAAADLADLIGSMEYVSNFFIRRGLAPEDQETAVNATEKEPVAKLPWDPDEYVDCHFINGTNMPGHEPTRGRSMSAPTSKRRGSPKPNRKRRQSVVIAGSKIVTSGVRYRGQSCPPTTLAYETKCRRVGVTEI